MRCHPSAALLFALCITFGTARAQSPDDAGERFDFPDREVMHVGAEPLKIRGLDQGPDGFRAATPALQDADTNVARVDTAELRRRRLALYDGGSGFDAPVRRVATEHEAEPLPHTLSLDEPERTTGRSKRSIAFVLACAASCGGLAFYFLRRR